MSDEIRVVLISCPVTWFSSKEQDLARTLVEEGLAACVHMTNYEGGWSVYRWKGKIETAHEYLLIAKTTAARVPALIERVKALHTSEVPEIIALPVVDGLPDYLNWVRDEVDGKRRETD